MNFFKFYLRYRETFIIAFQSLYAHRTRSLLTALGIIFGVGAVIAMLSIGEGARQESLEQIEVLGVRNIIIRSAELDEKASEEDEKTRPFGVSIKDAAAIQDICEFTENIAISWESDIDARTYEGELTTTLIGATPAYADIFNIRTSQGSFFIDHHLESYANVCVIGWDVKKELFGFEDPIGKLVKLGDQWFNVIGVIEGRKASTVSDVNVPSANDVIFIPLNTAMAKFPREAGSRSTRRGRRGGNETAFLDRNTIDQIAVQINDETEITEASRVISNILKKRHNNQEDFQVTIPEELIAQSQRTQQIFNIVMGAIAGISLLVGGIGIMNIMLASVLERTREIGVRRAIGATRSTIIVQFLSEAAMLSIAGGIIGILLGWGLTTAITAYAGWRTIVTIPSIFLAFSVAAATGIIFGYYPAKQAAEADVIESLRYE